MKKFKLLTVLFATLCFAAMISCEGPAGEDGAPGANGNDGAAGIDGLDGLDGTNGQDAASNCLDCHNDSDVLKEKIWAYQQSTHFQGTAYVRGSSATCAPCHASQGFAQLVAGETVTGAEYPVPVGCRTCHQIHTTFTIDDFALSTTDDVTLNGDHTDGAVVSLGKGNLCMNCHQSRSRGYDLIVDGTGDYEVTSSHFGPHYGSLGNVFVGNGLFEVPGSVTYQNSYHTDGVTDACVTCHLHNDIHTFHASEGACEGCHADFGDDGIVGDYGDFDYRGIQTEMSTLMDSLLYLMEADGLYTIDTLEDNTIEGHPHTPVTTTHNKAGAMFNYAGLNHGSYGIHNTKYTRAILQNSIEVFATK